MDRQRPAGRLYRDSDKVMIYKLGRLILREPRASIISTGERKDERSEARCNQIGSMCISLVIPGRRAAANPVSGFSRSASPGMTT